METLGKVTLLVDGNNLLMRAGFSDKANLCGGINKEPVGAILYGLRMLRSLAEVHKPYRTVIAWDLQRSRYRLKLYGQYKGQRVETDKSAEIRQQMPRFREAAEMLGITQIMHHELEADDIISWIALSTPTNEATVICSSDLDFAQLVSPSNAEHGAILLQRRDQLITPKNFREVLTVEPHHAAYWKALQGDASDNIPGIPGVAEITAAKWVNSSKDYQEIVQKIMDKEKKDRAKAKEKGKPDIPEGQYLEIFARNLTLVKLRLWEVGGGDAPSPDSWHFVAMQLVKEQIINLHGFTTYCMTQGLPSIASQMPAWAKTFPHIAAATPVAA